MADKLEKVLKARSPFQAMHFGLVGALQEINKTAESSSAVVVSDMTALQNLDADKLDVSKHYLVATVPPRVYIWHPSSTEAADGTDIVGNANVGTGRFYRIDGAPADLLTALNYYSLNGLHRLQFSTILTEGQAPMLLGSLSAGQLIVDAALEISAKTGTGTPTVGIGTQANTNELFTGVPTATVPYLATMKPYYTGNAEYPTAASDQILGSYVGSALAAVVPGDANGPGWFQKKTPVLAETALGSPPDIYGSASATGGGETVTITLHLTVIG